MFRRHGRGLTTPPAQPPSIRAAGKWESATVPAVTAINRVTRRRANGADLRRAAGEKAADIRNCRQPLTA
jgi:hypothetical protein